MSIDVGHEPVGMPRHSADDSATGRLVADRVRSELGPLTKALDQPRVHVFASDGVVTLHGDVSDLAAGAAIEACALGVPGVRAVQSHLHIGLLPSDTVPSVGHQNQRSPLLVRLEAAARASGFWVPAETHYVISGVLGVFALRLASKQRGFFLAHLPADVRRLAQPPRWLGDDLTSIRREQDFAHAVALTVGIDTSRADVLVRRILPLLRRHAPLDTNAIARGLPPALRAIWVEHPCAGPARQVRQALSTTTRSTAAGDLLAGDVMTRAFVSAPLTTSTFTAFDLIRRNRVHHLPILRPDGRCVAVLDAVTIAERMPEAWVSRDTTPLWRRDGRPGPLSVLPDTTLRSAARQMDAAGVDACCVVDAHGRMLGLLTCRDVIAAVAGRCGDRPRPD